MLSIISVIPAGGAEEFAINEVFCLGIGIGGELERAREKMWKEGNGEGRIG
jgi:hypothetical protein